MGEGLLVSAAAASGGSSGASIIVNSAVNTNLDYSASNKMFYEGVYPLNPISFSNGIFAIIHVNSGYFDNGSYQLSGLPVLYAFPGDNQVALMIEGRNNSNTTSSSYIGYYSMTSSALTFYTSGAYASGTVTTRVFRTS